MRVHSFSNAWTTVMQFSGGAAALLLDLDRDTRYINIDAGDFEIGNGWTGEIVAVRYSPGVLAPADFLKVSPPSGTFLILR